MKYDVDGRLYMYVERSKSGKIESLIKINGDNTLLRYDGETKERNYTKYDSKCMLAQRFQASESWVTVVNAGCNFLEQYEFPKKTSMFSFDRSGYINLFTTTTGFTADCVSVLGVKTVAPSSKTNYGSHITIMPRLSNSELFMDTKIAKNVRKHIHITDSD